MIGIILCVIVFCCVGPWVALEEGKAEDRVAGYGEWKE
jgi:hypothetical protein